MVREESGSSAVFASAVNGARTRIDRNASVFKRFSWKYVVRQFEFPSCGALYSHRRNRDRSSTGGKGFVAGPR